MELVCPCYNGYNAAPGSCWSTSLWSTEFSTTLHLAHPLSLLFQHTQHLSCDPDPALMTMLKVVMDNDSDDDQTPEWIAHTEYIQALQSSDDPLLQLLANIEDLDGTLCALGQLLEDEHMCLLEMINALANTAGPLAGTLVCLLEQTAHSHLPTLIFNMHTARHVLAHAHMQVQAYPDLVDHQAVLCNAGVDFGVPDPPATAPAHTF